MALLNSNLLKFFIQSRASLKTGGYFTYSSNLLNQIPIKKSSVKEQEQFAKIVDEIAEIKKKDISADTTDLENQIDQLVYKLYDLTEEEIKIIENA